MVGKDIEEAIFNLLSEYNGRNLITFKKFQSQPDNDLNQDFLMNPHDAYELLEK